MLEMNYCLCCQQFFVCICSSTTKRTFEKYGKAYPHVKATITIEFFEEWLLTKADPELKRITLESRK
jgi:hypothetical protein